ncbi:MAG: Porphyrin biosynthesis protein HemD [Thermoanaerobacterales bacterium 50_218]|nr:MAG: Porphyrin biosynthesis protein HemD [Thermoanaerobacterales bacterium 50_218]HAA89584.1 uroporphyrinogen-III C-methyltransferase [Peptococcaceae bacterium]
MKAKTGIVYLVGAGPGDPGLLTIKGKWCLQQADVVVYDRLVNEFFLSYCRPDAEIKYVGKKPGCHTFTQEQINALLAEQALAGKVVCRLKGGDPFVFGRGGEEAAYLAARGIPFEVVPGVTAAVAVPAYAGIPVTHRDYASSLLIATGHRKKGGTEGSQGETAVFLMGCENLEEIINHFLEEGWPKDTPAALIQWGTRAEQRTVTGNLENIKLKALAEGFAPPSVLVVGQVVKMRQQLQWWEKKPLFGKRILITRPLGQAWDLARRILLLGGEPLCFPMIDFLPPEDPGLLVHALEQLEQYDWVIFTSVNGVFFFMKMMRDQGVDIRRLRGRLAALGPATAQALRDYGFQVDYIPPEYRAEALLKGIIDVLPPGCRVLIPRAAEAREVIPEGLRAKGVRVDVVPVYRTVPAGEKRVFLLRELLAKGGRVNYITFTSSSTVRSFVSLFPKGELRQLIQESRIACIGPVTAAAAQALGLRVDVVATEYTTDGLLKAIIEDCKGGL